MQSFHSTGVKPSQQPPVNRVTQIYTGRGETGGPFADSQDRGNQVNVQSGKHSEFREESCQLAWHYTTGTNFFKIVETGFLLTTDAGIGPHEIPVLWFSRNQVWEPTSRKAVINSDGTLKKLTKRETFELGKGLVRFGFPEALLVPWKNLPKQAQISYTNARALETRGHAQGANPADWMGNLSKIPINELVIEVMEESSWVRI